MAAGTMNLLQQAVRRWRVGGW